MYIKNYQPEYWPSGDPQVYLKDGTLSKRYEGYLDIDDGPTIQYYKNRNVTDPEFTPFFLAATAKRSAEELYNIQIDPDCMNNLAGKPEFKNIRKQLSKKLITYLKATGDPREIGSNPEIWEAYPRLNGEIRKFPKELNQ